MLTIGLFQNIGYLWQLCYSCSSLLHLFVFTRWAQFANSTVSHSTGTGFTLTKGQPSDESAGSNTPFMPQDNAPEIYAALDLGSNSFHLQIARFENDKLLILDAHKDMVRFAAGLNDSNELSSEAQQKALDSLQKMAERLRGIPRDHIRIVGTNTLRTATNAAEFLEKAEAILPSPINIISGTEEARLIYLGVARDFSPGAERRLVIDIGGGSTELVVGAQRPQAMESLDIGCVSYSRRFFPDGKLSESGFRKAMKAAAQELSPYISQFQDSWDQAVGASGTIRSIGRILSENHFSDRLPITPEGLQALREEMLTCKNSSEVKLKGLSDERKPVLAGGLAILSALVNELGIEELHTSSYAIREGIIHDLAGRLHHKDTRESTIDHLVIQYHADTEQAARVGDLAVRWLPGIAAKIQWDRTEAEVLLRWAAALHEIGLAIAHGGYHKHGAYILSNADMPGFSRQEQARLAFLVLNHRRKPKQEGREYTVSPDWWLIALFRIACILHRRRQDRKIPESITLCAEKKQLIFSAPQEWLDKNPLTYGDLEDEQLMLKSVDIPFSIQPR